jgi:hypothetical protein
MDPTATPSGLPASSDSSSSTVMQLRNKFYGKNAALSYKQPLHIVRGQGCYLYDDEGAEYLDCVNNVASVGHANPQVEFDALQMCWLLAFCGAVQNRMLCCSQRSPNPSCQPAAACSASNKRHNSTVQQKVHLPALTAG